MPRKKHNPRAAAHSDPQLIELQWISRRGSTQTNRKALDVPGQHRYLIQYVSGGHWATRETAVRQQYALDRASTLALTEQRSYRVARRKCAFDEAPPVVQTAQQPAVDNEPGTVNHQFTAGHLAIEHLDHLITVVSPQHPAGIAGTLARIEHLKPKNAHVFYLDDQHEQQTIHTRYATSLMIRDQHNETLMHSFTVSDQNPVDVQTHDDPKQPTPTT